MPISIVCSGCDKKLKVKEEAAGKKIRCPGCSEVLSVPKLAEPEIDELEEISDEEDFEVRKPKNKAKRRFDDELDFDDGEDELGDEFPVRSKSSKKGAKKAKAKSRSGSSKGFLLEMYEGQLNQYLTYAFWGLFGVTLLLAPFGSVPMAVYFGTMAAILAIRNLIVLYWWAKLCSTTSSLGPLIFLAFLFFPIIGLIYGAMNQELCEKPNRMLMFTIGIGVMTFVGGFVATAIGISVLGVNLG